tara:strand:+ start:4524 stop:4814 length:291 start_codon:yes stop_codon:yes gene_type:complete
MTTQAITIAQLTTVINTAPYAKINGEPSYGVCFDEVEEGFDLFWTSDGENPDDYGKLISYDALKSVEIKGNRIKIGDLTIDLFEITPLDVRISAES